jgi:hypothetical protein
MRRIFSGVCYAEEEQAGDEDRPGLLAAGVRDALPDGGGYHPIARAARRGSAPP